MSKPARLARGARAELRAAARWYEMRRDGLGDEFLTAAEETIQRIRQLPVSGSLLHDAPLELAIRHVLFGRFPYAVVYIELANEIRILAFAHSSREPGYWKPRLT